MSTSLPQRAKELHTRLVALDQLGDNVKEASALNDLRSGLEPEVFTLVRALGQLKLLSDFGIEVVTPPSLDTARKSAAMLLRKFAADKRSSTLKKSVGWSNFIKQTNEASRDLDEAVFKAWQSYRQQIFTGEDPIVIRGRIAFTPDNTAAFAEYSRLHQIFRFESKVPVDSTEIEKVRALGVALFKAAEAFDFDVPVDVKVFLEAIQRGGAGLDLLTDSVNDWLRTNNAFDNYSIVPRSNNGRR